MRKFGMALIAASLGLGLAGTASAQANYSSKDGLSVSDGDTSLKISSRLQNRFEYVDNHRQGGRTETDESGFRIRRFKTTFSGTTFSKEWKYKTTIAWQEIGNDKVEDAWLSYKFSDDLSITFGRDKLPFNLEEMISSASQTFVDRSETNELFNEDRGNGLWISGAPMIGNTNLKYWLGLYDGDIRSNFRNNNDEVNGLRNTDLDWSLVGRVQFHPFGDNGSAGKSMSDIRSDEKREKLDVVVGLAGAYHLLNRAETGVASANGENLDGTAFNWTIDAQAHYLGFSLTAAFFHQSVDVDDDDLASGDSAVSATTDIGFTVTAGYNINLNNGDQLEFAVRYGMVDADDHDNLTGRLDTVEGGLAVNYRLHGDKLKFSGDINFRKDDDHAENNGGVFRVASEGATLRFQVQFVF